MRHVPRVRALNLNPHRIHTLCDLVGYTGGGEKANEVFAVRPAAHAWSYMGFCASSGAACVAGSMQRQCRTHALQFLRTAIPSLRCAAFHVTCIV